MSDPFARTVEDLAMPLAPGPESSFGESIAAGWRAADITDDSWGTTDQIRAEIVAEVNDLLGPMDEATSARYRNYASQVNSTGRLEEWRTTTPIYSNEHILMDRATLAATVNPGTWANIPTTVEALEAEVNRRRQAIYDEAQDVLAMGGGGTGVAEFVGGGARAMTDPINLSLAPFGGGGGGLLRAFGREALWGAAGEAAIFPTQRQVASELDVPEPDLLSNMATGAVLGGGLGAGFYGAGRGASYLRERFRQRLDAPGGSDAADQAIAIEQAEARLRNGEDPAMDLPPLVFDFEGEHSYVNNPVAWAFGQLMDRGYEPHIAAGLVGNLMQESGRRLNTRAVGDNGNAYGMGQWNGPRMRALHAFAEERNLDVNDPLTQIEFLDYELQGPERAAFERILAAPDAATAARLASDHFWRPGIPHVENRMANAAGVYDQFSDGRAPDGGVRGAASPGAAAGYVASDGAGRRGGSRRGYTAPDQVVTPGGFSVDVEYEVVDASTLLQAAGDVQPRDRSRAASDEQIADIAARLDPARLMPWAEADRGAPVVGPDNTIESGNGRVRALIQAAEVAPDRFAAYVDEVRAHGYDIPDGVTQPVLIARRTQDLTPEERSRFAREANQSGIARMSATEQAASDAAMLDDSTLGLFQSGRQVEHADNRTFTRAFLAKLPQGERAGMVSRNGGLSVEGARRIRQALFARAYGAADLIDRYTEADSAHFHSLTEALAEAAPAWAGLRADIEAGQLDASFDISENLLEAVRLMSLARRDAAGGKTTVQAAIHDRLAQGDLETGQVHPLTEALITVFQREVSDQPGKTQIRSAGDITEILTRYVDEAYGTAQSNTSLFGEALSSGPMEILDAIDKDAALFAPGGPGTRPSHPPIPHRRIGPEAEGGRADADERVIDLGAFISRADEFSKGTESPLILAADQQVVDELRAEISATPGTAPVDRFGSDQPRQRIQILDLGRAERFELFSALQERQPFDTVDDLLRVAEVNHRALNDAASEAAQRAGLEHSPAPLKARDSIERKLNDKYAGQPRKITDVSRTGVTAPSIEAAEAFVENLAARFHLIDEGWVVTPAGYFDRKLTVVFDDGQLGEIQVWPPGLREAKSNGGHALYRTWRDQTQPQAIRDKALEDMRALYAEARSGLDASFAEKLGIDAPRADSASAASSSDSSIARSSSRIVSAETGAQPSAVQRTASLPSDTTASSARSNSNTRIGDVPAVEDTNNLSALRAEVNGPGDFDVEIDGQTIRASELLDDLDADDDLIAALDACLLGGRGGG